MENSFNREFEQFVKQSADQYRMFPSEKVWNGVHNALHTRKRWYAIGLALLLLAAGGVTWVMITSSGKNLAPDKSLAIAKNNSKPVQDKKTQRPNLLLKPAASYSNASSLSFVSRKEQQTTIEDEMAPDRLIAAPGKNDNMPSVALGNINAAETKSPDGIIGITIPRATNNKPAVIINKPAPVEIIFPVIDNNIEATPDKNNVKKSFVFERLTEKREMYPLTIESVLNTFHKPVKKRKTSLEFYIGPTISYRRLSENKGFLSSSQSNNSPFSFPALYNVNRAVIHKPDIGLEMGLTAGLRLSKNLKATGGLQFNVSKYDIKAFRSPSEVATIALNTGARSSVSAITNYRNFDGYSPDWLHNMYFSISAPLGLEYKITQHKNTYLGVGSTVQPTYIIGDRAYLITTDYKNYAEVPELIRKWNMSTSFETFAGFSTGNINWRIGPQVRYQVLSSFQKKYPVKEHLFDFGLKLGIMLHK